MEEEDGRQEDNSFFTQDGSGNLVFYFSGLLSDRRSDDSPGMCFQRERKLSGCQRVCEAQEFNLVLGKTRNVRQNQFILEQCRDGATSRENSHHGNNRFLWLSGCACHRPGRVYKKHLFFTSK